MALTREQVLKLSELGNLTPENYTPQLQSFKIDEAVIECYSTYSYFDAKSYVKSPERSSSGAISNLNSYPTFLTPRLRINFSMMSIDTYRDIMKLIQSKNEFVVTCYDPVWNKMKTFKAYFSTEDYPELYIYDLHTLGVIGYEIELQGTNNELDLVSVVYHLNPPASTGVSDETFADNDVSKGQEILIGSGCTYQQETFNGQHKFKQWNEASDGSGFPYVDNKAYTVNNSIELYAIWDASDAYSLSYNYGVGATYIVPLDNSQLLSKQVIRGQAIGFLPNTNALPVSYDGETYTPYTFDGWYKTAVKGVGSEKLTELSTYDVYGNTTIYQLFTPNIYTIDFNSNGGNYTPHSITQGYGSAIYKPNDPTKSGYTFGGWYQNVGLTKSFTFGTMPPKNMTLYAKWASND